MKQTLFATVAMAALLGPAGLSAQRSPSSPSPAPAAQARPAATASAAAPAKPAGARKHDLHGRIVSINDTTLVASIGRGSKAKDSTFMLNSDTKREGSLTAGEMVKIEYWTHGTDKIATLVQVQALKTTAQSKPKSSY